MWRASPTPLSRSLLRFWVGMTLHCEVQSIGPKSVFVRSPIDLALLLRCAGGGGGCGNFPVNFQRLCPFRGRGLPWIIRCSLPSNSAPDQVGEEQKLRRRQNQSEVSDVLLERQQRLQRGGG